MFVDCSMDWPEQVNSCLEADPFGRPGCMDDEPTCRERVCTNLPGCCTYTYSQECANHALAVCDATGLAWNHSCFETSAAPGCNDEVCLKGVCGLWEECCTEEYTSICVELARQRPDLCPPPLPQQSCLETSLLGGCTDISCSTLVCLIRPSCCNSETSSGEWKASCVDIAQEVCYP